MISIEALEADIEKLEKALVVHVVIELTEASELLAMKKYEHLLKELQQRWWGEPHAVAGNGERS
jgi:hypothetical protein